MSLATWKKEFYPIPASKCKKKDALEHSLQKWIGLRKKNTDKHDVRKYGMRIESKSDKYDDLLIACKSCSLCMFYLKEHHIDKCDTCPLSIARGGFACDFMFTSPYGTYQDSHNPEPMIKLIRKAIRQSKKKGGNNAQKERNRRK